MAYKNSNTTSSIANEMGQWRYFNSNLKRLGSFQAPSLNISTPQIPVDAEVNWMNVLSSTFQAGLQGFGAYQKAAYDKAQKYIDTHSLEDYKKAIAENSIPFQDDPIAMDGLKSGYAGIVRNLVQNTIQNKIANNEYAKLTPEQMHAKVYEEYKKGVTDLGDSLGFNAETDFFFNQGYWAGAAEEGAKLVAANRVVQNDFSKKEYTRNAYLQIISAVNNDAVSADGLVKIMNDTFNKGSVHFDATEQTAFLTNAVKAISETPLGSDRLREIANKVVPGTNLTFRELIGTEAYDAYVVKANNVADKHNADAYVNDRNTIDSWVANGDTAAIESELQNHLARNGNVNDNRAIYLRDAYSKALKTIQTNNKKVAEEQAKQGLAYGALSAALTGKAITPDAQAHISELKKEDWLKALTYTPEGGKPMVILDPAHLEQMTPEELMYNQQRVLEIANSGIIPASKNPCVDMLKNQVSEQLSSMNSIVDTYRQDKSALKDPQGLLKEVQKLESAMALWDTHGEKFERFLSNNYEEKDIAMLRAIRATHDSGVPITETIKGISFIRSAYDKKNPNYIEDKKTVLKLGESLKASEVFDAGRSSVPLTDLRVSNQIEVLAASHFVSSNFKDAKASREWAVTEFNKSHFNLMGTAAKISFFDPLATVREQNIYSGYDVHKYLDNLDRYIWDKLKDNGVQSESQVTIAYNNDVVSFIDNHNGVVVFAMNRGDIETFQRQDIEKAIYEEERMKRASLYTDAQENTLYEDDSLNASIEKLRDITAKNDVESSKKKKEEETKNKQAMEDAAEGVKQTKDKTKFTKK